jgi:hypothetical protein
MPIEMHAIGAVEPIASVRLKSKVQGEILRVHFADGNPRLRNRAKGRGSRDRSWPLPNKMQV